MQTRSLKKKSSYQNEKSKIYVENIPELDEKPITFNEKITDKIGKKCGEIYKNKNDTFNYLCTICGKIIKGIEDFIPHIRIDHTKDFLYKNDYNIDEQQIKIDPIDNNEILTDNEINEKYNKSNKKRIRYRTYNKIYVTCKLCNKKFTSDLYLVSHLKYDHVATNTSLKSSTTENPSIINLSSIENQLDNDEEKNKKNDEIQNIIIEKNLEKKFTKKLDKSILDDPFKCRYCGKRFRGRMKRFEHECLHTGDKPFKCDICGSGFRKKYGLDSHIKTHTNEKPFKCEICNEKFKIEKYLKNHMNLHNDNNKKFICRYCYKGFSRNNQRKIHERLHTNERPYKCNNCEMCFTTLSGLNVHLRRHTGIKPHKCQYCGKAYFELQEKKTHEKIHIGERPYVCKICDARYTTYRGLKLHIKEHSELTENDIIHLKPASSNDLKEIPIQNDKELSSSTSSSSTTTTPMNIVEIDKTSTTAFSTIAPSPSIETVTQTTSLVEPDVTSTFSSITQTNPIETDNLHDCMPLETVLIAMVSKNEISKDVTVPESSSILESNTIGVFESQF